MRMLKIVALLGLVAGVVSACNTIGGAGQDVQAGGRAIERSADDVQKKM